MVRPVASVLISSIVATCGYASSALAAGAIPCTCRYEGRDMPEGAVVCIDLASGTYLARCGKVANNTAWIRLRDGCPTS